MIPNDKMYLYNPYKHIGTLMSTACTNKIYSNFQLQFSDAYDFPDALSGSFSMQIVSPHVHVSRYCFS